MTKTFEKNKYDGLHSSKVTASNISTGNNNVNSENPRRLKKKSCMSAGLVCMKLERQYL